MTPHIVIIENAFDDALVRQADEEWPGAAWDAWTAHYNNPLEKKSVCNNVPKMPPACSELMAQMLTMNIEQYLPGRLVPDINLWGGGMHCTRQGGHLDLHLDANFHFSTGLKRRVNAILFINQDWRNDWGGDLELWDSKRERCTLAISPVFNRLVLFESGDTFHTVSPVSCPTQEQRRTLACWWYGEKEPIPEPRARATFVAKANEPRDEAKENLRIQRARFSER